MRSLPPTISTWVWRLPRCQASRMRSSGDLASISVNGSGLPATHTTAPSSSTRPSPSFSATARSRSSRNFVPFSPVSTMRRRCRSSASSTTRSIAPLASKLPAAWIFVARRIYPLRRAFSSEQKVPLRHRQHVGWRAGQKLAVGGDLVGLRIDGDGRRRRIVHHVLLAELACILDRDELLLDPELFADVAIERRLRDEHQRARGQRLAERAEHRPVMHRLRRRNRGIGIAHRRRRDRSALDDEVGFYP